MSIIDKVIAAVTPPESDETRRQARQKATAIATPGSWFAMVLTHHEQIESAFAKLHASTDAGARHLAQKELALVLNGHSLAEEVVLYPALSEAGEKAHMTAGYTEQSAAKVQMALLENIEPMSQDYLDKLGHIEGAVKHHMYEEESTWFPEIQQSASAAVQAKLTLRFREEFERYAGGDPASLSSLQQAPAMALL